MAIQKHDPRALERRAVTKTDIINIRATAKDEKWDISLQNCQATTVRAGMCRNKASAPTV